jgi:hypothetical protein
MEDGEPQLASAALTILDPQSLHPPGFGRGTVSRGVAYNKSMFHMALRHELRKPYRPIMFPCLIRISIRDRFPPRAASRRGLKEQESM